MNTYASDWVRQAYKYLQECELNALRELIWKLPKGSVCVNIGAGFGTSGIAFIENPDIGKLYTIDIYETEKQSTLGNLEYEMGVFRQFGFDKDPRYKQIPGDSIAVSQIWNGGMLDMIFVDGDHSYEHCKNDIYGWHPHMKRGSIMAFHDYKEPIWPGVTQAIEELLLPFYPIIINSGTVVAFRLEVE